MAEPTPAHPLLHYTHLAGPPRLLLKLLALAGGLVLRGCCQAGVLLGVEVALDRERAARCRGASKGPFPCWWHPAAAAAACPTRRRPVGACCQGRLVDLRLRLRLWLLRLRFLWLAPARAALHQLRCWIIALVLLHAAHMQRTCGVVSTHLKPHRSPAAAHTTHTRAAGQQLKRQRRVPDTQTTPQPTFFFEGRFTGLGTTSLVPSVVDLVRCRARKQRSGWVRKAAAVCTDDWMVCLQAAAWPMPSTRRAQALHPGCWSPHPAATGQHRAPGRLLPLERAGEHARPQRRPSVHQSWEQTPH